MRRTYALGLVVVTATACSSRASAPSDTAPPPTVPTTRAAAPIEATPPAPPTEIGPLVPWVPASAWHGRGIPPKQLSLYDVPQRSPVLRYASLDRDACEAELRRRGVAFERAEDTPGVRAPVRLGRSLHGVDVHPAFAHAPRSQADLVDCRLALSLDDFAASLAARGIVEVAYLSAHRTKKEYGCTAKYPGEQHCAALAVDVASFRKQDGTRLVVERDFHGKIGTLTCATEPAKNELWEIACAAAGRQFQVVLTPNWNFEHKNHLHLELTVHDWVLVR